MLHYKSKLFDSWLSFLSSKRLKRKESKKMDEIADQFFQDLQLVKGIKRFKNFLSHRNLFKTGDAFHTKLLMKRGLNRWTDYHDRYLKLIRKARIFNAKNQEALQRTALRKLHYNCELVSWKSRVEKRLFFYWDRRNTRIISAWRNVTMKNKIYEKIVTEHSSKWLIKRAVIS